LKPVDIEHRARARPSAAHDAETSPVPHARSLKAGGIGIDVAQHIDKVSQCVSTTTRDTQQQQQHRYHRCSTVTTRSSRK
jgi:hypothetical protein